MSRKHATMAIRLPFPGSLLRLALAATAVVWLATSLQAVPAGAQAAPPVLEVVTVEHDPAGFLHVGLRGVSRESEIRNLTLFVDGVPVTPSTNADTPRHDLALMLVIDTSGSMLGQPMEAARDAARALLDRLPEGDRVAVLSFADMPLWQVGLTDDRALARAVLAGLWADGSTALYDAVGLAAREMSLAHESRRVVLLLSDGRDFGGVSLSGRDGSLEAARSSGAVFHAVGLGSDYDEAYLTDLAHGSGGEFYPMRDAHDAAALTALFERLGNRLGATSVFSLPVGALARGEHTLQVRAVVDGRPVTVTETFPVTNVGLLDPVVTTPSRAGDAIEVAAGAAANGVAIEAEVAGLRLVADVRGVVRLDPWSLTPGTHEVTLRALTGGREAAIERVTVEVPHLDPFVAVTERDGQVSARGVAQAQPTVLAALRGDREVARSADGTLTLPAGDLPTTFRLLTPGGELLAEEISTVVMTIAPSDGGPATIVLLAVGGAAAALAAGVVIVRRVRRRPLSVAERVLTPVSRSAEARATPAPDAPLRPHVVEGSPAPVRRREGPLAYVVVIEPGGGRRTVPLAGRPVTVGSSLACDIVLGDPVVRAQHLRLTALPRDEVQVHVLPQRGARPHLRQPDEEEFLIAHYGEQIDIGGYCLQIVRAGALVPEVEAVG